MSNENKKTYCLYHADCLDGIFAAWALRMHLGNAPITFLGVNYGDVFESRFANLFDDAIVYIVDFSITPKRLFPLVEKAERVYIFDHHKTAIDDWYAAIGRGVEIPSHIHATFNIEQSGAMLTWMHFTTDPAPLALSHVADRDIWKFKVPGSREHHAYLRAQPWLRDFDLDAITNHASRMERDPVYRAMVYTSGETIMKSRDELIYDILKTAMDTVVLFGHRIPVAAIPKAMHSEAGEILYNMYPTAPFVLTYADIRSRGVREYSFRSRKIGGADVKAIATHLGGGGHQNAAGVSVPLKPNVREDLVSLVKSIFDIVMTEEEMAPAPAPIT